MLMNQKSFQKLLAKITYKELPTNIKYTEYSLKKGKSLRAAY